MTHVFLVPQLEVDPMPLAVKVWSLNHWLSREFPCCIILNLSIMVIYIYFQQLGNLEIGGNRIYLPMEETQVQSLVWEDSTTKPMCHNC